MESGKNWFIHVEWVVVLITLLGGFYTLDAKIERQSQRTDTLYETLLAESEKQSQRSDRLYEMFIDLLKEGK